MCIRDRLYCPIANSLTGRKNNYVPPGQIFSRSPFATHPLSLIHIYTGAQNFNPYQALAMFSYNQTQAYDNWIGSHLMALPNDELKWQKTKDYNIGFDLNLWGRLMIVYDYYVQQTKDQLLALTIPPSMGFTSYMENIGSRCV